MFDVQEKQKAQSSDSKYPCMPLFAFIWDYSNLQLTFLHVTNYYCVIVSLPCQGKSSASLVWFILDVNYPAN